MGNDGSLLILTLCDIDFTLSVTEVELELELELAFILRCSLTHSLAPARLLYRGAEGAQTADTADILLYYVQYPAMTDACRLHSRHSIL